MHLDYAEFTITLMNTEREHRKTKSLYYDSGDIIAQRLALVRRGESLHIYALFWDNLRSIPGPGTNSKNPGLSRRFRDSWSLCSMDTSSLSCIDASLLLSISIQKVLHQQYKVIGMGRYRYQIFDTIDTGLHSDGIDTRKQYRSVSIHARAALRMRKVYVSTL